MFLHVLSNSSAEVRGGIASASRLPASLPMLGGVPSHLTHFTLSRSAHGGVPPPPRPPRVSVQVQHLCLSQCREAFSTMLAERQVVIPPPSLHHWVIYPLTLLTPSRRCSPSDRPPRPPRRPPRRTSWRTRGKPTTWYAAMPCRHPPASWSRSPLLSSRLLSSRPPLASRADQQKSHILGTPPPTPFPTGLPPSFHSAGPGTHPFSPTHPFPPRPRSNRWWCGSCAAAAPTCMRWSSRTTTTSRCPTRRAAPAPRRTSRRASSASRS